MLVILGPVNKIVNFKTLNKHLHSLKSQPNAIPYITSYYNKYWGFCISHKKRKKLKKEIIKVFINSNFKKGNLKFGEIYIKGKSKKAFDFYQYMSSINGQ